MRLPRLPALAGQLASTGALLVVLSGSPQLATSAASAVSFVPLAIVAPHTAKDSGPNPACTTPAPVASFGEFHCYTPSDIYKAYGVDKLHAAGLMGKGQTIVLVDSYGSPTAASDIQFFHDAFFKDVLPNPWFDEIYPLGNPTANYTCNKSRGLSGPFSACLWSFEATLDIEWAYAIAPLAHIVLLATPPAETLGVPGLPNMFKGIQMAIDQYPAGTVFSQSFGLAEETFGGAALNQMNAFDQTYQNGITKGDSFLASSGDQGNGGNDKNHKLSGVFGFNVVGFPAVSPLVTAVGGTQLMLGWKLAPTNADPIAFTSSTTNTEPLWTECNIFGGGNCVTGGGTSSFFAAPSWQSAQSGVNKGMRSIPDLSWNAAVNGGVLVYISSYPSPTNPPGWFPVGGTSASSPQMAGVIALANEARKKNGLGPLGNLGPHIYSLGNSQAPDSSFAGGSGTLFRDIVPQTFTGTNPDGTTTTITIDNNAWPPAGPSVPPFFATAGYDLTTGFGSPHADAFVTALAKP